MNLIQPTDYLDQREAKGLIRWATFWIIWCTAWFLLATVFAVEAAATGNIGGLVVQLFGMALQGGIGAWWFLYLRAIREHMFELERQAADKRGF